MYDQRNSECRRSDTARAHADHLSLPFSQMYFRCGSSFFWFLACTACAGWFLCYTVKLNKHGIFIFTSSSWCLIFQRWIDLQINKKPRRSFSLCSFSLGFNPCQIDSRGHFLPSFSLSRAPAVLLCCLHWRLSMARLGLFIFSLGGKKKRPVST